MKTKTKIFLLSFLALVIFSCNKSYQENGMELQNTANNDTLLNEELDSSLLNKNPEGKVFQKKAEIDFEVKEVYPSVKKIEQEISDLGGYVTESNVENSIISTKETAQSKDSIKQWLKNKQSAYISARVPQNKVGAFLNSLDREIEMLNHRNFAAEELTFDYALVKDQTVQQDKAAKRIQNSLEKGGKLKDEIKAEKALSEKESDIIYTKNQKAQIEDKVNFTNIDLKINGPEILTTRIIANFDDMDNAQSPLGYRIKNALSTGLQYFVSFMVGLFYLWPFILIIAIIYFFYNQRKSILKTVFKK